VARAAAVAARREAARAKAAANACATCSSAARLAVRYDGWREQSHYGEWREEWQHFSFASPAFAALVSAANGERCKAVAAPPPE
jgi:hypothetical protein